MVETTTSVAASGAKIPRHQYVSEVGETRRTDNSAGGSATSDDFERATEEREIPRKCKFRSIIYGSNKSTQQLLRVRKRYKPIQHGSDKRHQPSYTSSLLTRMMTHGRKKDKEIDNKRDMVYAESLRQSTDWHRQNDYAILGTIEHQGKDQRNIRKGKVGHRFR